MIQNTSKKMQKGIVLNIPNWTYPISLIGFNKIGHQFATCFT